MPHQVKAQLITAHRQVRKNPFIIKTKCKHYNAAVIDHKAVQTHSFGEKWISKEVLIVRKFIGDFWETADCSSSFLEQIEQGFEIRSSYLGPVFYAPFRQ